MLCGQVCNIKFSDLQALDYGYEDEWYREQINSQWVNDGVHGMNRRTTKSLRKRGKSHVNSIAGSVLAALHDFF